MSERKRGNKRIEAASDKRREISKGQRNRKKDRHRIKEIQREFIELVTQMHESDLSIKEWVTWLHFEVNMNTEKIDNQSKILTELIAHIISLKEMI